MKAFLDTNIFIYAAGKDHQLKGPSLDVLKAVASGDILAVTNTEVIQELFYIFDRRGRRKDGLSLGKTVIELVSELYPVGREAIIRTADLMNTYANLPARDAVHAATMLENDLHVIITADKDFSQIRGLQALSPLHI